MKELSIKEKARAYDEALENARQEYNTTENVERKQWLEELFPELAESEDEKIRKELIDIVAKSPITFAFEDKNKVLSWLERQGEQKPWSEEDEKVWKELIEEVKDQLDSVPAPDCRVKEDEKVLKQLTRWLVWLKSLKQKYTWKPSDEQMKALDSVIDEYDGYPEFDSLVSLKNDLRKL